MLITIKDESATGKILNEILVSIQDESTTVKEIISARVTAEVKEYNQKAQSHFNGLVQPTNAEQTLNGYKLKYKRKIDEEQQVYIALDAFQKNGFFVLINDIQAETLDQEVLVDENSAISFVKLTPLVGG